MTYFHRIFILSISLIAGIFFSCNDETASEDEQQLIPIDSLFESFYQESLLLDPLLATYLGDYRYNDTITNYITDEYIDSLLAFYSKYDNALKKYEINNLNKSQQINLKILQWECNIRKEGLLLDNVQILMPIYAEPNFQFLPINQTFSFHLQFCGWAGGNGIHPFKTVKDYDDWLSRINDFAVYIESVIGNFKKGIENNIVYPKIITQKMIVQLENLSDTSVKDHVFFKPIKHFPDSFTEEEKRKLSTDYANIIKDLIIPKFIELKLFLEETYLFACRESVGLSELPGGKEAYDYLIRYWTTTNLTADEIFDIGIKEVERISNEILKVKEQVGYTGELINFLEYVRNKKELMPFTESSEIINNFKDIHKRIEPNLDKLFLKKPKAKFEIQIYESFLEGGSTGQYDAASIDGSRPGILYIPVGDPKKYNILSDESFFIHEIVPGHHFQISLQRENKDFSKFRKPLFYGAYGEGWALYAESLGKELGLYTDPYQYLGTLSMEMHRALRLVIDVGIHSKRWTREQAIKYSQEYEAYNEDFIISEIDRYIAGPGQALSYKIGHLKMLELKAYAEKELGDQFDIKEFHDQILSLGNVPLQILEEEIYDWVYNIKIKK